MNKKSICLSVYGSHDLKVNYQWVTSDRKINVTHKVGNVGIQVTTGRGGATSIVYFYIIVPDNWGYKKIRNFVSNHFPKKKVNRTLVAAGVKFWDWDTKTKKQVAIF